MKPLFGLVGLLAVAAIVIYFWSLPGNHPADKVKQAEPAREEAQRLSGRGNDGEAVESQLALDPVRSGGQVRAWKVVRIAPGERLESHFGLRAGDEIRRIGGNDASLYDAADLARAMIQDAYQKKQKLEVRRGGQSLTLP